VFQLTYDVLKEIHLARRSFVKSEKYTLGSTMEESLLTVLLKIVEAGKTKSKWKLPAIESAQHNLEKCKILIRLAIDLEQIRGSRVNILREKIHRIGRELGGWKRSL